MYPQDRWHTAAAPVATPASENVVVGFSRQSQTDRQLFCSAGMLSAVSVVSGAGNLAFNIVVARLGGAEAYGAIGALLGVASTAAFLALGIQYALARRVAVGATASADIVRISPRVVVLWTACMAVLGTLAMPITQYLHLATPAPALLTVLLIGLMTASALPLGVALGLRLFGWIAALQLAGVGTRLVLGIALVGAIDAPDAALLATIVGGGIVPIGLGALLLRSSHAKWHRQAPRVLTRNDVAVESGLGAIASAALWALWSLPLLFARHGLSSSASGDFAAVQVLCSSILFVCAPVVSVFYPAVARAPSRRVIWAGLATTLAFAAGGLSGITLIGPSLVRRIYGGPYVAPQNLFLALSGSAATLALVTYCFWMLRAVDRPWVSLGVGIATALLVEIATDATATRNAQLEALSGAVGALAGSVACGVSTWWWQRRRGSPSRDHNGLRTILGSHRHWGK